MNRLVLRTLHLTALVMASACGGAPQQDDSLVGIDRPAGQGLQQFSFTGVAEPASGRVQVFADPQAAIGQVPESADGNVLTVAANTVQVQAPTVSFNSTNSTYPAGCNKGAPMLMQANVEIFSGYAEQLRNVYANVTATSSGPTFCATNSLGTFAGAIGTSLGAYLYQPLNGGTSPSAIKRSVQWSLNLPGNSPFWFRGNVWAEVIPQPPSSLAPADGVTYSALATWLPYSWVTVSWIDDPQADGTNPEGFAVARPTGGGASLTIMRCGPSSAAFDAASCTTSNYGPTAITTGSRSALFATGYWYQWSVRSSFTLPGSGTATLGSAIVTRHFGTTP